MNRFLLSSVLLILLCTLGEAQNNGTEEVVRGKATESYNAGGNEECGAWSACSASCGPSGVRARVCQAYQSVNQSYASITQTEPCNTVCLNKGVLQGSFCECPDTASGSCCELDSDTDISIAMVVSGTDINFECELTSGTGNQVEYRWYANENMILSGPESTLAQSSWIGYMGSSIRCEADVDGDTKISSNYFAGVKTTDIAFGESIELSEGGGGTVIQLESTVPLLCTDGSSECQVVIPIVVTDRFGVYGEYVDAVVLEQCGAVVTQANSVDGSSFTITVKARRDFFRDGDGSVYLGFLPIDTSVNPLWDGYHVKQLIELKTVDRDYSYRKCSGTGDPHYYTCDGQRYDIYMPGEYIFYKHETQPYEVQTRLAPCGSVACNCGVAVRVNDDVIVVDRCKVKKELIVYYWRGQQYSYYRDISTLTIEIFVNGEMTPGFRLIRENSGNMYKIHLPTGASIEIQGTYIGFGVYFAPAPDDYGIISGGFCGSCDSDKSNDLLKGPFGSSTTSYATPTNSFWDGLHELSESWRTPDGYNLFYGEIEDIAADVGTDPTEEPEPEEILTYCTCSPSTNAITLDNMDSVTVQEECSAEKDRARSHLPTENSDPTDCTDRWCDVTEDYIQTAEARRRRRRRSTGNSDLSFEYDPDFVPSVPSWPTPSGITESDADTYCNDIIINSAAGVACAGELESDEKTTMIDFCKTDILVMDSLKAGDNSAELMKEQCEESVSKDPTNWVTVNGALVPPASVVGVLCPSDCSGNGTCVDGVCECYANRGGTDCSINLLEAPEVFIAHDGGLCDASEDECLSVDILGNSFVASDALTCHYTKIKIGTDGFEVTDEVTTLPGIFVSFELVRCPSEPTWSRRRRRAAEDGPDEPEGSLVSVSNDGVLTSYELVVIIHNSRCDECNGTQGYCVRRDDICISDGECYDDGHIECMRNTYIIIGVVVGSLVILAIIVVVVAVVCTKKKKRSKVNASDEWNLH